MSHLEELQAALAAALPSHIPSDTVRDLADLLDSLLSDTLSGDQWLEAFSARPSLRMLRWIIARKAISNGTRSYIFDDASLPHAIDARSSQGFIYQPKGPVVQLFAGAVLPGVPLDRLRIFFCFDAADDKVTALVDAIVRQVGQEFEIFVLHDRLVSEYSWRDDLYVTTGICDGAIVFLSLGALRSHDFCQAVSMLTLRTLIEPSASKFQLFPVLVDPLTTEDLANGPLGRLFPDCQSLVQWQMEDIDREVMLWLQELRNTLGGQSSRQHRLESLGRELGDVLSKNWVDIVEAVARSIFSMRLESGTWAEPATQLAWALWHTTPDRAYQVVESLLQTPRLDILRAFVRQIRPGWIDPWLARRIAEVAHHEPSRRAVSVNCYETDIAHDFVLRAYCLLNSPGPIVDAPRATGEDEYEGLYREIRSQLIELFVFEPDVSDAALEDELDLRTERKPFFITIPGRLPRPRVVKRLLHDSPFRHATFFFVTDGPVDPELQTKYKYVVFVDLPMDRREIRRIINRYVV